MASTDRDSSYHHCGGLVKLVQACLCAENTLQRHFNRGGSVMRHVQVCLWPVLIEKAVYTTVEVL